MLERIGDRYSMLLHGIPDPKLIRAANLKHYKYCPDDRCPTCAASVNLNALPPCSCQVLNELPKQSTAPVMPPWT